MENPQNPSNPYLIPGAIVMAGLIIAGALYFSRTANQPTTDTGPSPEEQLAKLEKISPVTAADHILGNPEAPIKIVEFSDLECPFCKQFHNTLTRLMSDYGKTGELAWVYRHFPIDNLHPKARSEAYALECAAEIGGESKFWPFMNEIMAITPSNNGLEAAELPKIATRLGIDRAKFETCLASDKYKQKVDNQIAEAIATGAQGTPWSIMLVTKDSKVKVPINGSLPYDDVKGAIDELLAKYK
ncbi:MAG: thioredoxin domain-containing protein [Patescibacteria group bacterium]